MAKLQIGLDNGKKGSTNSVYCNQAEIESFDKTKHGVAQELILFPTDIDKPYIERCYASEVATGAVFAQKNSRAKSSR